MSNNKPEYDDLLKKIQLNEFRLNALLELSEMKNASEKDFYDFVLEKAVEFSESQVGFLGFVHNDQENVTIYSWSQNAMQQCEMQIKSLDFNVNSSGIWAEPIRQRKAIIINDFKAPLTLKKGLPVGHIHINNYASIPHFDDDKIVALLSVGNKKSDYDNTDVKQLSLFMNTMWKIVKQRHYENELRKQKEQTEIQNNKIHLLYQAAKTVLDIDDFKTTAHKLFENCKQITGATSGYVALLNEKGEENEVLFLDAGGLECTVDETLPMPIRGLRGIAYKLSKAVFHNDFMNSEYIKFLPQGHVNLKNVMFAPLLIDNKAVGLIGLANKPTGFTDDDLETISAFGELASIALKNSRNYEKLQKTKFDLQESEKNYKLIFNSTGTSNSIFNTDCILIQQNQKSIEFLGKKAAGLSVFDIFGEKTGQIVCERMTRVINTGISEFFDTEFVLNTGKNWFRSIYQPMFDENNKVIAIQIISRNITDIKNKEAKILSLSNIIKNSLNEIYIFDKKELKFKFANNGALKNIGYSIEELKQISPVDLKPEFTKEKFNNLITTLLNNDTEILRFETIHQRKNGSIYDVSVNLQLSEYENEEVFVAFIYDITEKKNAEREIIKQKKLFETMFDTIQEGVVITNTNREILLANKGVFSVFGYNPHELIGKQTKILYADTEKFETAGKSVFGKDVLKPEQNYLTYYKDKTGQIFPGETFGAKLYDVNGEWIGNIGIMRDVSEREKFINDLKQAKEYAEKTGMLLSNITENMLDMVSITNYNAEFVFVSKSHNSLGYNPDDLKGKNIFDFVHPDDEQKIYSAFNDFLFKKNNPKVECRFRTADNNYKWIETIGKILNHEEIIFSSRDISERIKYEQDLQIAKEKAEKNQQLFQSYFETNPTSTFVFEFINNDFYLTAVNETANKITNNKAKEFVGLSSKQLYADLPAFEEKIFECYSQRSSVEFEENYLSRSLKQYSWVKFKFVYLEPNKVIIYSEIITKQKLAEQELIKAKEKAEESEERFKNAMLATRDGLWEWNIKTNDGYFSPVYYQMLGYEPYEFPAISDEWEKRIHPQDKKNAFKVNIDCIENKTQNFEVEFRMQTKNEDWIWILAKGRAIKRDSEGKAILMVGTHSDITERKLAEQELIKAKEKAEESDRLKTAFLQNISHEIRTPLNAICGFSQMLNKEHITVDKRKSFVSIIQSSSDQLLAIVSDILAVSSLETGQEKINIKQTNINSILLELMSIFKPKAYSQNISLYLKQQLPDNLVIIETDETKLRQILTNLLSNALKFTHEGFIELGYEYVTTHSRASLPELQFYVKDTGIGIKPEFHDTIFERFRQADKTIHTYYGGTGLGLSISKGYVEMLGGKIWVQSEIDKGSTFYFTIPYNPVNKNETVNNQPKYTILVAEDEEFNFLFIEELLMNISAKLIHAKNGQEAVDIVKTNPNINLILMDIKMPVLTGDEAAKIIKSIKPDLPVIAQSAYALEQERAKFEGIFDDYITKPINENLLKQIVKKYIDF